MSQLEMINENSISIPKNPQARNNLNHSVLEKRTEGRVNNTVQFTEEKQGNSRNKTTDDLALQQLSKSIGGPTHYTSNISQKQAVNSQMDISTHGLPNINLSRQQQFQSRPSDLEAPQMNLHQVLQYGPIHKQFLKMNKKAVRQFLKQSLNKMDPFKGYTEVTHVSQHLRKHQQLNILNGSPSAMVSSNRLEGRSETPQPGGSALAKEEEDQDGRDLSHLGITSKVMETWINETLADAEHLDIPGVVLKPEHKNPISRYGIDRMTLTNSGIPNQTVDRVYRCLFVYSVGFYELIKKILAHSHKKYQVITSIWKVFSVMLEYCCQSDYRMLISEITNQHKEEVAKMELEFQAKCQEFLNNEKILKQNMEVLQKYSEELEKERTNERTLRLKLEEEYMQNSKNHEEEVQLRLKFESKLNSMHSMHRELEIKHKRMQNDLASAQMTIQRQDKLIDEQTQEIIVLKTIKAEHEARIELLEEKKSTLDREVEIKNKLILDVEGRMKLTQDDSDLLKYQLHEQAKEMTEQRLKVDCLETKIEGLQNEKTHLEISLKETREFRQLFESKSKEVKDQYGELLSSFNENQQKLIGFEELLRESKDRIEEQKKEMAAQHQKVYDLDRANSSLRIELDKMNEYYRNCKSDLDETVERLHQTNRVRHELEIRLQGEKDANEDLRKTLDLKMAIIDERERHIASLEQKGKEQHLKLEALHAQMENMERLHEQKSSQFQEKVDTLSEIIKNEKEAREMWADRYEKEQKEHVEQSTEMLLLKSSVKDLELEIGNMEIKLEGAGQTNAQLQENLDAQQAQLNEKVVLIENQKREILTQNEAFKQLEQLKKEFTAKMNEELSRVKESAETEANQLGMTSEDFRSQAIQLAASLETTQRLFAFSKEETKELSDLLQERSREVDQNQMVVEDLVGQFWRKQSFMQRLQSLLDEQVQETQNERMVREKLKVDMAQRLGDLEKDKGDLETQVEELTKELGKVRDSLEQSRQILSEKRKEAKQPKAPVKAPTREVEVQTEEEAKNEVPDSKESKERKALREQDGAPQNKLIGQAQKSRDNMNRQLQQQIQKESEKRVVRKETGEAQLRKNTQEEAKSRKDTQGEQSAKNTSEYGSSPHRRIGTEFNYSDEPLQKQESKRYQGDPTLSSQEQELAPSQQAISQIDVVVGGTLDPPKEEGPSALSQLMKFQLRNTEVKTKKYPGEKKQPVVRNIRKRKQEEEEVKQSISTVERKELGEESQEMAIEEEYLSGDQLVQEEEKQSTHTMEQEAVISSKQGFSTKELEQRMDVRTVTISEENFKTLPQVQNETLYDNQSLERVDMIEGNKSLENLPAREESKEEEGSLKRKESEDVARKYHYLSQDKSEEFQKEKMAETLREKRTVGEETISQQSQGQMYLQSNEYISQEDQKEERHEPKHEQRQEIRQEVNRQAAPQPARNKKQKFGGVSNIKTMIRAAATRD